MTGKEKCEYLKRVRREFAQMNKIEFTETVCNHIGECRGHCPACDKETEELFSKLKEKQSSGEYVSIDESIIAAFGIDKIYKEIGDHLEEWEMGLPDDVY